RRHRAHPASGTSLADNAVSQENKAIVDVGNTGFIHIQRQTQIIFQKRPAFLADGLGVMLVPLDDDHKVIGKSAVRYSRLPLTILANRNGSTLLNAEVPCPAVLACFLAQV